ncbi:MAG: LptF/LptG family permease, partial [Candidatus Eisenbacteria bacterium]|nr:LptF/LptG family permease [Candidatus Eisenbacteria bacterium]
MILRRYVLTSLIRPFFLGFGFITFLLTMEMLLDLLDLLIGKGIDVFTVARLFVLALGWMVALSVPCGVLVAVLMTYGRMSQDNEITALRASGVHLFQIITPTLWLSVILAGALTAFNNYVLPESNYAYAKLLQQITRKNPTARIREGVILQDFEGYSIRINRLDDRTGLMEDVLILDSSANPQSPRTILASRGRLHYDPDARRLSLELEDGTMHEADPASKDGEYRIVAFDTQTLSITDAGDPWGDRTERRRSDREMSIGDMETQISKLELEKQEQQAQIDTALVRIGVPDLAALSELDPQAVPRSGWRKIHHQVRGIVGAGEDSTKEWTADEKNVLELLKGRLRERTSLDRQIQKYEVEIHKKFSIPAACVVFVLVGAPLGMLARRGGMAV